MAMKLSEAESKAILGVSGSNTHNGTIRADEFLPELRGKRAIRTYQQMRDNDATIGAVLYAVEQILRDVDLKVVPVDDSAAAIAEAEFVESVLEDMEHTLDDHISEALSFLSFGFAWFEVVYKRRVSSATTNLKKLTKFPDGRIGVRKLASRAPWTVSRFDVDQKTGDILGMYQDTGQAYSDGKHFIPTKKSLYYRTTVINGDPSGRSILRNAYTSYTYLNSMQAIEAIAVERELAGIPIARVPAEYLAADASADQRAFLTSVQQILRDVKFNEQGYIVLPSDMYPGKEGEPSNHRLVDIELMSSSGTRNIDIDPVIRRYQHDIARSVLSEFLMLGGGSTGSYALSKSKTDLFLRALEAYIQTIVDVLNKQLVEQLWQLNGLDPKLMPKIIAGDVAPHDLKELGSYLRNLNGADINLASQPDIVDALLANAELPKLDRELYEADLEAERRIVNAKAMDAEDAKSPQTTETRKLEQEFLKSLIKGD
jgi:hypothetical protein